MQITSTNIHVADTTDKNEIKGAFHSLLYVPEPALKAALITRLIRYIQDALSNEDHKLKTFIGYHNSEPTGIVISQIYPTYLSYGRKCGTLGWLNTSDFETCKALIRSCERFIHENGLRKIRGNINFPKDIGGFGIQTKGFDREMLFGVSFNDPTIPLTSFLERLGYKQESEYICIEVIQKTWNTGKHIAKNVRLGYMTVKEMWERIEEFHGLIAKSFHGSLPMPDTGGRHRLEEIIKTYDQIPQSHFKIKISNFTPKTYCSVPEYQEAWESCDIETCVMGAPMAFERQTGRLIGAILAIPNLYQAWANKPMTQMNVDTVMVDTQYTGKGIFSALNNIGQLGTGLNGIRYFEGTSIWNNNPDAKHAIFPHGIPVRTHVVMQKRLKKRSFSDK